MYSQHPHIDVSGQCYEVVLAFKLMWFRVQMQCTVQKLPVTPVLTQCYWNQWNYFKRSLYLFPCALLRLCCHCQLQDRGGDCRSPSAGGGESAQPGAEECECLQIHHSSGRQVQPQLHHPGGFQPR